MSDVNDFYSDDVKAEAIAENHLNPDMLEETEEDEVTTGDMEVGDMDNDPELGQGDDESYDEENMPGGDNYAG